MRSLAYSFFAACAVAPFAIPAHAEGLPVLDHDLREVVHAHLAQPSDDSGRSACRPKSRPTPEVSPLQTLDNANSAARQRPAPDKFDAARQVYTYAPGALYELYANPNYVSTILLEPGETLSDIAAGDTSRWMVTEATGEAESEPRTIVLVKPHTAGLRTNIVLITDRRTYLVEASSQASSAYAAQVAWTYPQAATPSIAGTPVDRLNFAYRISTVRGKTPAWSPSRVFDDGRRTWIEFAPGVVAGDMPPIFVVTAEGAEIVNYRVHGQRYLIDRVFDRAELRLGSRRPVIVRIDREAALTATQSGGGRP